MGHQGRTSGRDDSLRADSKRQRHAARHTAPFWVSTELSALMEIPNTNNYQDRIIAKHRWPAASERQELS